MKRKMITKAPEKEYYLQKITSLGPHSKEKALSIEISSSTGSSVKELQQQEIKVNFWIFKCHR